MSRAHNLGKKERLAPDIAEKELIASVLAGQTHLYHDLVRPHERTVYLMAFSFLKNEAEAQDVAQDAFIKAYRNLAAFRGDSAFGTWLISITLNEARNRLRQQAKATFISLDEPIGEAGAVAPALLRDWREIPSEALERDEVRRLLQGAVESLPALYRAVFLLRDVEDFTVSETAEALQISISNVKVRLHRARMMLQKQLAPQLRAIVPVPVRKRRWMPW